MDESLPKPINGPARPCKTVCQQNCNTNVYEGREWGNMNIKAEESESDSEYNNSASESESEYGN